MVPFRSHNGTHFVNLSIKNVPDPIVERLRERAAHNHRSLQGELLAIIASAVEEESYLTPDQLLGEVRKLRLPSVSESADILRADRDR